MENHRYVDYVLKEKTLLGGEKRAKNILEVGTWMRAHSTPEDRFLVIKVNAGEIGHLVASSHRPFIQSLNLRYYRGPGMGGGYFYAHYDIRSYQFVLTYFEEFLGISMNDIVGLDRDSQLTSIHRIVTNLSPRILQQKVSIFGEPFNYIISNTNLMQYSPLVY